MGQSTDHQFTGLCKTDESVSVWYCMYQLVQDWYSYAAQSFTWQKGTEWLSFMSPLLPTLSGQKYVSVTLGSCDLWWLKCVPSEQILDAHQSLFKCLTARWSRYSLWILLLQHQSQHEWCVQSPRVGISQDVPSPSSCLLQETGKNRLQTYL